MFAKKKLKVLFFIVMFCQLGWGYPMLMGQTPKTQKYVKALALAGDGVNSLLARYRLERHDCNEDEFYAINALKKGTMLKEGVSYKLPITAITYDGKTVKSSLKTKDDALAERIKVYNERLSKLGIKSDFRKNKILWLPHGEEHCDETVYRKAPGETHYKIFGKKHADITLKDNLLAGAVYYLISGHGGPDPGAMARVNKRWICEDEYAYDVTLRLAKNLLEHGARVYMITQDPNDGIREADYLPQDRDEVCYPNKGIPVGQKARLGQRTDVINTLYELWHKKGCRYQRVIEIHVDSRSKREQIDLFFYYMPDSTLGRYLATLMHKVMASKYAKFRKSNDYDGVVHTRDLFTLRESKPPAVFIELGNIHHVGDRQRIMKASNRQTIADWLCEGALADY